MKATKKTTLVLTAGLALALACQAQDDRTRRVGEEQKGDTSGEDDSASGDDDYGEGDNTLTGVVMAPSGAVPISGALVYLTKGQVPDIPDHVYNYQCDDMGGKLYALSEADGSFEIEGVPPGDWQIVTRKGNFRRVRDLEVTDVGTLQVQEDKTTLPGRSSADGLDRVPRFAVLLNSWDRSHDLLAKFGMGDLSPQGELLYGTESFDLYSNETTKAGYPPTSELFKDQATLDSYHMIFLPCPSDATTVAFAKEQAEKIRQFVSKGGKVYNSCCTALWTEAAFPEYIEFYGGEAQTGFDVGRISSLDYSTTGRLEDEDLSAWLQAVAGQNPQGVNFTNGYVKIDGTQEVDDGHGLKEDDGVVRPYTWVTDIGKYPGSPLMVTYNFDYGKVFYSVYETSNTITPVLTPQEHVLLYVILEIGVCENIPVK